MYGFGENPALDRAMAINMNGIIIQKQLNADPALKQYNTPDFVLRAARWSYKELGWGRTDLEGYIEAQRAKGHHPVRLYHTNNKLWSKIRKDIFERDNHTCAYCGQRGGVLEVDHIQAVSKGGTNDYQNLTAACFACNRSKRDKSAEQFRAILKARAAV